MLNGVQQIDIAAHTETKKKGTRVEKRTELTKTVQKNHLILIVIIE